MKNQKMLKKLVLILLALSTLTLLACKKDPEAGNPSDKKNLVTSAKKVITDQITPDNSEQDVSKGSLLNRIPSNTVAFYHINAQNPFYDAHYKLTKLKTKRDISKIDGVPYQVKYSFFVLKVLRDTGLMPGEQSSPIQELLNIFVPSTENALHNAIILTSQSNTNQQQLEKFQQAFKANGFQHSLTKTAKGSQAQAFKKDDDTIYLLQEGKQFVFSTSTDFADQILVSKPEYDTFDFNKTNFTNVNIPNLEKRAVSTWVDVEYLLKHNLGQKDARAGAVAKKLEPFLNLLPKQASLATNLDSFGTKSKLYLPKNQLPSELKEMFSSKKSSFKNLCQSSVVSFDLNLGMLFKVAKYSAQNSGDQDSTAASKIEEVLKQLPANFSSDANLGIAVCNQSISGMPDLQITFSSNNPQGDLNNLKKTITEQAMQSGAPQFAWKEKVIADQTVSYIELPFGFGIYLVPFSDAVMITSSEFSVKSALSNQGNSFKRITTDFKLAQNGPAVANVYFDYPEIYKTTQSLKSLMSMFVPQNNSENQEFNNFMKSLAQKGKLLVATSYQKDNIVLETSHKQRTDLQFK